jgi:hypothetical protein
MCSAAGFGMSQVCQEVDIILPVVIMAWLREDMKGKDIVESVAGRELKNVNDLFECMMRRHYERTLSYWGTRAFAVWTRIIYENEERLKEELDEESNMELDEESNMELDEESNMELDEEVDSDSDIYG